ncbi:MAG TPA: EamA family transporter [Myxococcota bacterium]|nr:EamA family transporter [Myxococcota bacterium]
MTPSAVALCIAVQAFIIVGQLLLKRGMAPPGSLGDGAPIAWRWLVAGVVCFAAWFFLWLGILRKWDVSQVYPFDALNSAGIALAARVVLHETLPTRGWLGIGLITLGILLVSQS